MLDSRKNQSTTHDAVRDYYGKRLQSSADLRTSACCEVSQTPDWLKAVLRGVRGLLKPGGEFYFSDVYADRRVDPSLRADPVIHGENRLFRIDALENACEDHGQAVVYRGTIPGAEARFVLDVHHDIETARAFPVCGNTWRMLHETRFRAHFDFVGDFSRHFGLFPGCGGTSPFTAGDTAGEGACC